MLTKAEREDVRLRCFGYELAPTEVLDALNTLAAEADGLERELLQARADDLKARRALSLVVRALNDLLTLRDMVRDVLVTP